MEGAVLSSGWQFAPVTPGRQEICQPGVFYLWLLPERTVKHLDDAEKAVESGDGGACDGGGKCRDLVRSHYSSGVQAAESAGHDRHVRRNRRIDNALGEMQRALALPTSLLSGGGLVCSSGCAQVKGTNPEANPTPTSSPSLATADLTSEETPSLNIAIDLFFVPGMGRFWGRDMNGGIHLEY